MAARQQTKELQQLLQQAQADLAAAKQRETQSARKLTDGSVSSLQILRQEQNAEHRATLVNLGGSAVIKWQTANEKAYSSATRLGYAGDAVSASQMAEASERTSAQNLTQQGLFAQKLSDEQLEVDHSATVTPTKS